MKKNLIQAVCGYCPMRNECKTYRFFLLGEYEENLRAYQARKDARRKERTNGKEEN